MGAEAGAAAVLGVEIDSDGLAVHADLAAFLGEQRALNEQLREYVRAGREKPHFHELGGGTVGAGKTYTYIRLDGPSGPDDRAWEVMRYWVSGPDPFTTLAGVSVISFVSKHNRTIDSNSLPENYVYLIEPAGQVPNSVNYGRRGVLLRKNEQLILGLKGLSSGQQILAGGLAVEYPLPGSFTE